MDELNRQDDVQEVVQKRNLKFGKSVFEPDALENARFMQESDSVFAEGKNAFALRDELRNASYRVKNGKRGTKKKHTKSMQEVIDKMDAVQKALNWEVSNDPDMLEAQLGSVTSAMKEILYACDAYAESHKKPRSPEGKVRRAHVDKIRKMIADDTFMLEQRAMEYKKQQENNLAEADRPITWLDMFASARCEVIKDEEGLTVHHAGAGTSDLLILRKEGQPTRYLKRDDIKTEFSVNGVLQSLTDKNNALLDAMKSRDYLQDSGLTLEQRNEKKKKIEAENNLFREFSDSLIQSRGSSYVTKEKASYVRKVFFDKMVAARTRDGKARLKGLIQSLAMRNTAFGTRVYEKIAEYDTKEAEKSQLDAQINAQKIRLRTMQQGTPEYEELKGRIEGMMPDRVRLENEAVAIDKQIEEMSDSMLKIGKQLNAFDLAENGALIGDQTSLAKRNAATYRLAKFFGYEDLVVKAEMKDVKIEGASGRYMEMEEAKGKTSDSYRDETDQRNGKKCRYSLKAVEQLSTLQVLDVLCGQIDRHQGNYYVEAEDIDGVLTVTKVHAIDNDLAFGLLDYNTIKESGKYQELRSIEDKNGNMTIPGMSKALADKILAMTPGMVDYLLIDLLSKEELDALKNRLKGLQDCILRRMAQEEYDEDEESKFAENDADWERIRSDIELEAPEEAAAEQAYIMKVRQFGNAYHMGALNQTSYYRAEWLDVRRKRDKFIMFNH